MKGLSDAETPSVRRLLQYVAPVIAQERCVDVLDRFIHEKELLAVAVVDQQQTPVGIVDRGQISDIFLRPFSRDLLHNKRVIEIMDASPIIVDINSSIDDVAQIIIDAGMRHMVNGFIILEKGVYVGMATGHALLEEITHRRQRDLYVLAHYDQLTGLPNRLLFNDRLEQGCRNAQRNHKMLGLVFVDLDRFKYINDTMGHSFGDRLLVNVAERLLATIRQSDTVARLGGDEFVLILQNIESEEDATTVLAGIVDKLLEPMPIFEREIQITASLGMAFFPKHDQTTDGLIRKADAAMYEVKERGRNAFLVYTPTMDHGKVERMSLETQLRMALNNGELSLSYQPQIQLPEHRVVGVEALLRWQHPQLGAVPPTTFIPIAEETGLIVSIGEWVINEACRQHLVWIEQGLPALRMAVNISGVQFKQREFCGLIKRLLEESGIDPQYLELELTESVVMTQAEHAVQTLMDLRTLGVKLAIDDFGTGYSSLSYLRKFPLDRIKIDQSFIRHIKKTPANEAIVRAIIALGESLGLETVAEGVENGEELACVTSHHCHEVQGYHFAKPLSANDFSDWHRRFVSAVR
ncbi:putative bifunctional diguanylate cyclase/phosphodiesterase [Methylomonas sp. 2BW1-5-20]|uniref:putative bifunctional diguanylate cyclase/phosphodiesterase n=1 Tax=Methylomonas sp. 2BW1-5-20 TaxID=3376686 RepID=UPI004051CAFD